MVHCLGPLSWGWTWAGAPGACGLGLQGPGQMFKVFLGPFLFLFSHVHGMSGGGGFLMHLYRSFGSEVRKN